MKTQGKTKTRLIKISLTILAVVLALIAGAIYISRDRTKKIPQNVPANTKTVEGIRTPQESQNQGQGTPSSDDTPSTQPIRSDTVSVTITQWESNSSKVSVRALVDGLKSGKCIATFTKSGQKGVTQTVPIGIVTSYYACQGFDVPSNNFPIKGTWKVQVRAEGNGVYNLSAMQSIEVR